MAPNTVLEPPPVAEAKAEEKPKVQVPKPLEFAKVDRRHAILNDALLENSDTRPKRPVVSLFFSVFIQAILLVILLLIPLFFTEAIDLSQFTKTFLVAPPPPPPPPPPAVTTEVKIVKQTKRVFTAAGKLVAPVAIPKQIAMLKENPDELGADIIGGVPGGVAGGVPGGQIGGVIGGIISSSPKAYLPPPTPTVRAPVRVGGRVMAPRVLSSPDPIYPVLAKQARIQGDVQIDAVIDVKGNIVEMQAISGHPLLIPAALDALRRWKYQPTILNDEPVPVQLIVTIRFRLQ